MLLAIFACHAIALPLSPSFPTDELQYILDNSEAKVLLATETYADKADQLLPPGLKPQLPYNIRQRLNPDAAGQYYQLEVQLEDQKQPSPGGLMLYTSGTTDRPVGFLHRTMKIY